VQHISVFFSKKLLNNIEPPEYEIYVNLIFFIESSVLKKKFPSKPVCVVSLSFNTTITPVNGSFVYFLQKLNFFC